MNRRATFCALAAMLAFGCQAQAQEAKYPSKPIKLIVGYSPGGSNDLLGRIIAKRLQDSLGQPVVVENRPSTAAILGAVVTSKAPADGYTLMIGASGPLVINAATHSNLPYSPEKDFTPISLLANFPMIVSVKADSKFKSFADLVKYTKENPRASNYASSSSTFQLATELLKEKTGLLAEHIPFKGSGDSMQSIASGQTTFSMLDPSPAATGINGNLLRGLAVTSEKRMKAYPDIPTLKEAGVDLQIKFWLGLFAPAGTPTNVVKLLERETAKAVFHPETVKSMEQIGLEPIASTSEALAQQVSQEIQTWTALAKQKNIKTD